MFDTHLKPLIYHKVSLNKGVDFSSQNPLFEYKPVPIVQSITPAYGSIDGGTTLRVIGNNFSKKSARFCLFWSVGASLADRAKSGLIEKVPIAKYNATFNHSPANRGSDSNGAVSEVTCATPSSRTSHFVHVLVVSDEDLSTLDGSLQARGALFRYHEEIKVSGVLPASSTVDGNVTVDIFGGPFISDEGLFCMFGDVAAIPGTFHSPNQVSCTSPPHASGTYSLEVTQNGQDYTRSGQVFRFYQPCNISSISPISGPSKRAGTNVKVYGENFVNTTSLKCRFGSIDVPVTFVRSSEILCSSPPIGDDELEYIMQMVDYYPQRMRGRLVSFEVSNNGQDFTSSGHEFLYLADIEASRISRHEGPSHGGTPVFVSGFNFGTYMAHPTVNVPTCCCRHLILPTILLPK